jgi:hypothetical protein
MKPVARGVNIALKKPGLLQKLVDAVSGLVPLEKIKEALKTTLYPQYQKVCNLFAPTMSSFGGVAGQKIIEFLQVMRTLATMCHSVVSCSTRVASSLLLCFRCRFQRVIQQSRVL